MHASTHARTYARKHARQCIRHSQMCMPTIPLIFRYDRRRPRPRRRPPCRRVRRRSFDLAAAVALAAAAPLNRGTQNSCCVFCRGLWLRGFFRGTPSPEYTSYTLGRMVGGRMLRGVYRSVWSRGVWSEAYTGAYGQGAYGLGRIQERMVKGRMLWGVWSEAYTGAGALGRML